LRGLPELRQPAHGSRIAGGRSRRSRVVGSDQSQAKRNSLIQWKNVGMVFSAGGCQIFAWIDGGVDGGNE